MGGINEEFPPHLRHPRFEIDSIIFIPGKYIYLEGAGPGLSNALFRSKIRPRSSEKSVLTFMISSQNGGDLAPSAEGPGRAGRALCVRLDTLPLKGSVADARIVFSADLIDQPTSVCPECQPEAPHAFQGTRNHQISFHHPNSGWGTNAHHPGLPHFNLQHRSLLLQGG